MIRGAKVGDVVEVRPMRGKHLDGTVVEVTTGSPPLHCVATIEGHHWVSLDEMWPSDAEDHTKPVGSLTEGETVILPLGTRRVVSEVVVGQQAVRIEFRTSRRKTYWPQIVLPRGARIRVISPEDGATA